jgi:hypothetical protein
MKYPLIRPAFYLNLLKELGDFLKQPENQPKLPTTNREKVYKTLGLIILKPVFLIPVILFFALVYDPENVQQESMRERFSPLMLLVVGGLLLPLLEEIAFRLSLKFNVLTLALTSAALTYYLLTKAVFHTKVSAVDDSFMLRSLISIGVGLLLFIIINRATAKEALARFWQKNFKYIFYLSCLVFAWIHISKYEVTLLNVLLLPILTLPQLYSAIIYGYTRVAFGFAYPLLMHIALNTIAISMSLLIHTS